MPRHPPFSGIRRHDLRSSFKEPDPPFLSPLCSGGILRFPSGVLLLSQNRPHKVSCIPETGEAVRCCRSENSEPDCFGTPGRFHSRADRPPHISRSATAV